MRISTPLLVLVIVGTLLGCGREARREAASIEQERFIEANVALRQIPPDTAAADSLRQEVLAEHGVSEEELRAFVLARTDRPAELSAIWEEIHRRMLERRAAEAPEEDADGAQDPLPGDTADDDADIDLRIAPPGRLRVSDTLPSLRPPDLRLRTYHTLDTLP